MRALLGPRLPMAITVVVMERAARTFNRMTRAMAIAIGLVTTRIRMRTDGLTLQPAFPEAARFRLRRMLTTTRCALLRLLPLASAVGPGGVLPRHLALAVVGGLTRSTPITLLVVPTLLVAIHGRDFALPRHR